MESINDYACTICTDVFNKPCTITACGHSFCKDCIQGFLELQQCCPICRTPCTLRSIVYNKEIEKQISTATIRCLCDNDVQVATYSAHCEKCPEYQASIEKAKTNLLDKSKMKKTVNRATFTCPVCKTENLERKALVEHILTSHPRDKGVCPICVCQPWGDPNKKTHLATHMNLRHQFDYDTYTDYDKEDEDILSQVIEMSKNVK